MGEYEVKSWSPDYVMVEGPKRIWEKKTFIETLPVNDELKTRRGNCYCFSRYGGFTGKHNKT